MKIEFLKKYTKSSKNLVFFVDDAKVLLGESKKFDLSSKGIISRSIKNSKKFSGKLNESLEILEPLIKDVNKILVFGVGNLKKLTKVKAENLGGQLFARINSLGDDDVSIFIDGVDSSKSIKFEFGAYIAFGSLLGSYSFLKYFTKERKKKEKLLKFFRVITQNHSRQIKQFKRLESVASGIFFTRDLVTEPPNVLTPPELARHATTLKKVGVNVKILGENEMKKLKMFSLLGVGQGSPHESKLAIMNWRGNPGSKKGPIAFVGKGVCFDTGGVSIKPSKGMEEMKYDMGGAGTVIGLIKALASRKAKVNAIGVVGLVENAVGGNAQRPSDVVKSMSGQTIEVLNTDAEGRLVLADALWYVQSNFKPQFMVDLATLTGSIVVALGYEYAGLFTNSESLAKQLVASGEETGEKVWRMPLSDDYNKKLESEIADMQNISYGYDAGSITAAQFLQRFTNGIPWAHLDIAGMAWTSKAKPTIPKGATGYGVRLLDQFVESYYENK